MDRDRIERGMQEVLVGIGANRLNPEVLANTPRRIAAMYAEFFEKLDQDPGEVLEVLYQETYEEMIVPVSYTHLTLPTN